MLRLALSAAALAGASEMVRPALADPVAMATFDDRAEAFIALRLAPEWSWPAAPTVRRAARAERDKEMAQAGGSWLGPGNAVPAGRVGMSLIVAGGMLVIALLVGVVLDGIDVRRRRRARRDIPPFDAW